MRLAIFCAVALLTSAQAQAVDPRGPVAAYNGKVLVDRDGVRIAQPVAAPTDHNPIWNPSWITLDGPHTAPFLAVRFRKQFDLPATPVQSASALITADPAYRLWVNGILISRGPDDPGNDYSPHDRWSHQWLANRIDIAPQLHPGHNVIAAEVFPGLRGAFSLGTTAFALTASITFANGHPPLQLDTGSDWLATQAIAYTTAPVSLTPQARPQNAIAYDARLDDPHWREPAASAAGWSSAAIVPSVWGPVATSQLPPIMEAVWPIQRITNLPDHAELTPDGKGVTLPANGRFQVEFDRVLSGYLALQVDAAPGTLVTVWPAELPDKGRHPFSVIAADGLQTFESPNLDSFSSLTIVVANASGPVHIRNIRATFASQPVAYRGSFTSSDQHLNALWQSARWQTQLCLQNRFLDSPDHLEPIGDPGDYLIEAQVADATFGPIALTHQYLRQFAAILDRWMETHPTGAVNFHTSYALLWLQTLLDDYDRTGDPTLARETAPSAHRLLARFAQWIGPNGLLSEAPNYLFMDWVTIEGFNAHHPPAVIGQGYLTAFYYRALGDALRLAQLTGDQQRIAQYTSQRQSLLQAFNRELWDEKAGLYRDGKPFLNHNPTSPNMLPPDRDIETHSPQINALAVLYDLAPKDRQQSILARILSSGNQLNVQPYFMHFLFAAEAHAGVFPLYAAPQLARWTINPRTQTFPEMWSSGDWSHGWGATPLLQMTEHTLGVAPAAPGYAIVTLAPNPLSLSFAKGIVPSPHGDIAVSWQRTAKDFTYNVTLPQQTSGRVDLSGLGPSTGATITLDGHILPSATALPTLSAGAHTILYQAP